MRLSKKLIVIGVAITAASAVVAPCSAAGKAFTASSQVALNFQLIQKSGLTRVYQLPQGAAYWAPALPIVHGDRLNADVSLVGGDDKINQSDALVDGKKVCTLTQAPWILAVDTANFAPGHHSLDIVVQIADRAAAAARQSFDLDIVSQLPAQYLPQTAGDGPADADVQTSAVAAAADQPWTPAKITGGSQSADPGVTLSFDQPAAQQQFVQGTPVSVGQPLNAVVSPKAQSVCREYVFCLTRDGNVVYNSSHVLAMSGTRIRLQPKSGSAPGLLPGRLQLSIWGIDSSGNFSEPLAIPIDVSDGS